MTIIHENILPDTWLILAVRNFRLEGAFLYFPEALMFIFSSITFQTPSLGQ